jgi:tetratricopeptide (TPR) repeat protein
MWLKKTILLLCFQVAFSQSQQLTLEDKIYKAVDVFVAHPTVENLNKLEVSEKTFHPKSKSEWLALVILQCNKAYYQNQLGFTKKAITSYEKSWQWYQKKQLSNYDIVESCLQPLGNLYTIIGDYDNAENTIKQYFYIANLTNNHQQKYAAILNLSNVYQNTGKVNDAIDLLKKTLATEKLTATQKGVLSNNLGANYLIVSKSDDAKKAFELSVNLLKSDSTQSENISNAYRNLAKIYTQQLDYNLANYNIEKAYGAFYKSKKWEPRKEAKLYYDCAYLFFEQGNYDASQKFIVDIFTLLIPNYKRYDVMVNKKSLYAETVLLDAFDLQAAISLAQNQPERALENYQLSFYMEELFQALLVYENSKIISQIRNRNRTEKCIAIYYSLYQKDKNNNYLESAFLLSEQTKSAVLKQSLSEAKTKSREEKRIVEQLQNWNTIILKEQQKLDNASISKINEAIKKQNELMLLLKSKATKTANESEELDIKTLYSKLEKDNAVLVEYFVGKEKTYSFTIENNAIKLQIIADKFDEHSVIRGYLSLFKDANSIADNPTKYNQQSNVTYTLLQLPKKTKHKNLIIIPDGILNFLPFESLITKQSSTTNFAKMHYLLNDFKIGYSNSADFYLNAIPFQHKKESILGVFPLFEKTDLELAFSKKELQNIKTNFDGNYLESQNANFSNFKLNAANYSILHLSTHASSGDLVEPASIKFYDQEILYSELYHLDIHPDLVVLSACETGLGKLYKAEGAMSVARGFQFAGAQNLLFSLWKVNDYTTSVFMDKFYKNVKKGHSFFDSNHQAKIDFLADESISNTKKSPYYWSAFVYYGALEEKESNTNFLYIGLVLIVGIVLVLLFRNYKKSL